MRNRLVPILLLVGGLLVAAVAVVIFVLQPDDTAAGGENAGNPDGIVDTTGEGGDAASQPAPQATTGPTIEVVVAWQTVQRGWQMTEAELSTDVRLVSEVGPNVITDPSEIIGLYARTDIYQGETLTLADFASDPTLTGQDNYGPSSLVPTGWVGLALPMDRLNSVAYGISEGDTVDIMLSFMFNEIDEQFQTLLNNSASFVLETTSDAPEGGSSDGQAATARTVVIFDPYGRFETLPTGDIAHIAPSEPQRPFLVSMVLQNAKVVQVGPWTPTDAVALPTAIPDASAATPTPGGPPPTPTPRPPDVVVIALPPQQQLLMKYAMESNADIDFALRGAGDGQITDLTNVDLNYILQQFNFDLPPNFNYTVDTNPAPLDGTPNPATEPDEPVNTGG